MIHIYLLTDEKYNGVKNYPVIKINFLTPSVSFENIDYLMFTSKNGVRAIEKINKEWKRLPSFVIGKSTAKEIYKFGGKVKFISKKAYGDEFAKEIISNFHNKSFLFFRAKKIISPIREIFKKSSNKLIEKIVYKTICNKPSINFLKPSVVIFTSPSTVKCFSKNQSFNNIIPIAIGIKTKQTLEKFNIKNVLIPKVTLISECIKLAKSLKF